MQILHVAAGIIIHPVSEMILIAKRLPGKPAAGMWEFPGGRIERDESSLLALQRELREETGIEVQKAKEFLLVSHDYPDRRVLLNTYIVTAYSGEPYGVEGQEIRWVMPDTLPEYEFPAANDVLIEKLLQQPHGYR